MAPPRRSTGAQGLGQQFPRAHPETLWKDAGADQVGLVKNLNSFARHPGRWSATGVPGVAGPSKPRFLRLPSPTGPRQAGAVAGHGGSARARPEVSPDYSDARKARRLRDPARPTAPPTSMSAPALATMMAVASPPPVEARD